MSGKRRYPQWFVGHKVNEILFCEEFRKEHPMICVKGKFFTKDGLIEDEAELETEIFNAIKFFVTEKVSMIAGASRSDKILLRGAVSYFLMPSKRNGTGLGTCNFLKV